MMLRAVAPFWPQMSVALASLLLTACGGGGGSAATSAAATATPPARAAGDPRGISGTAANVVGTGLVLQINGGNDQSIPAGAEGFAFDTLPEGMEYRVSIKSQPSGQACTLLRGAGIVGPADIIDVTLNCIDNVTDALAGTYAVVSDNLRDFVTFYPDGTFVVGTHENDPDCLVNDGNGIEYGVYNWDATTGNFNVIDVTLDTNGECGLFNENEPEASAGLLVRSIDGSLSLISRQDSGGAERSVLKPVTSIPGTLVGGFGIAGAPDFAVFSNDGTYFVATTQADPVSGTLVGIEDACYATGPSLGASSGTVTVELGDACGVSSALIAIDTNGTAGFPEDDLTQYSVVGPNVLTFSDDVGPSTLMRILPNTFGIPDRNNLLAGTYFSDLGVTGNRNYITFYADSTFVLGSHENDQACGQSLGNGVEYGVYRWNRATSAFQFINVIVDTNGDCGAADVQGTLAKTPDGFTFTDNEDGVQTAFTVVLPALGNPLLGSSRVATPGARGVSGPEFVVFTNDGRYFQANPNSEDSSQPTFGPGIEDGCYSEEGAIFITDLGQGCSGAIDTNGDAGFSSLQGNSIPYQTTGADTLRLLLGQFEQNDVQLTRMLPNSLDPLTGTYALAGKRAFITFYDDGAFALGSHDSDPRLSESIPSDVEFGVYSWTRGTGDFRMLAGTLDTNNDSGILNVTPETLTQSTDGTLMLTEEGGQDLLTPVESIPGSLIGSFFITPDSPRNVAVFASDGSYFLTDLSADPESGDVGSIEDGCYATVPDSSVSGSFTPSTTRCLSVGDGLGTLDTNSLQGFPDGAAVSYLRLDPSTLQLQLDRGGGGVIVGGGV